LESAEGYANRPGSVGDRGLVCSGLGLRKDRRQSRDGDESAVGEASGAAVGVGCHGAKKRAELERRLECLAVEVVTALAEHDGAVRELSGAPETRYGR